MGRRLRIAFLHPDLGIGGAERLVLDAALTLQSRGHRVCLYTAHRDRERCFAEAGDGSLEVRVHGDFLPLHLGDRLRAPCTIARMHWAALALAQRESPDLIFTDLVAHVLPWVRFLSPAPVIFYCHFPDYLLAPPRRGLYALYRRPLDRWEEYGTGRAHRVLVNSRFTAANFSRAFPRLRGLEPEVLYPGVEVPRDPVGDGVGEAPGAERLFVALHRFEPAKNVALAIEALACLRALVPEQLFTSVRLVVAGGYDERLRENRETLAALEQLARRLGLSDRVAFHRSIGESERRALLSRCTAVLYTAEHEHFGYVPLEAMAASRPVIAVDSGGPRETIVEGETGYLCPPSASAFAERMAALLSEAQLGPQLGRRGRAHVARHFSLESFGDHLARIVDDLCSPGRDSLGSP